MACSKSRRYRSARLGEIGNHKNRTVIKNLGTSAFRLICPKLDDLLGKEERQVGFSDRDDIARIVDNVVATRNGCNHCIAADGIAASGRSLHSDGP